MSFTKTVNLEESEKYPPNIQKLFAPGLPIPYADPIDYPIERRKTKSIAPVSDQKDVIDQYIQHLKAPLPSEQPVTNDQAAENRPELILQRTKARKLQHQRSFQRQLDDWNNPDLLLKNEQEFMKDPYNTVFVARLDYKLTEIDISQAMSKFGPINSIRIVRNTQTNKSRGYGFVVFEKDMDAKACVRELAATGLKIPGVSRTILVDMERGRIIRNWKPRRLGGGLGGRHYTNPQAIVSASPNFNPNASAAASGRRMNLPMNPYQDKAKQPRPSNNNQYSSTRGPGYRSTPPPYSSQSYSSQPTSSSSHPAYSSRSIRDKYSNYSRSSNSIRQRE